MPWIPGVPIDDGANIHGTRTSRPMVTCHRTYGFWPGDYSVIKSGGLAHLLIGPDEGEWMQFAPTEGLMYHCNGSNDGYGIEVGGTNADPMTDWQLRCLRYVVPQLEQLIGVPLVYSDGSDGWVNGHTYVGFHAHNGVLTDDGTSQHTNLWTLDDWSRIVSNTPAIDWAAIAAWAAAVAAEEQRRNTMGAPALYIYNNVLCCDFVDGKGNVVHKYSNGGAWAQEIIAGPDAPKGRCTKAADPDAGVSYIPNALTANRIDITALAADASGVVHGYYLGAWNSDFLPGVGSRPPVTAGGGTSAAVAFDFTGSATPKP